MSLYQKSQIGDDPTIENLEVTLAMMQMLICTSPHASIPSSLDDLVVGMISLMQSLATQLLNWFRDDLVRWRSPL